MFGSWPLRALGSHSFLSGPEKPPRWPEMMSQETNRPDFADVRNLNVARVSPTSSTTRSKLSYFESFRR